ncbi:hypothetical protein VaNZ11_007462 [Volvox africanus]|uniref:CBF1-interacting co-repressor CIR N-terminal domain-containing protein n=1 Tax=Volvox africanus TaxID=51714 RepID=A0ABQ5S2X8_9CHLO|nr:hypothetical protein VaNZ11_007462 [Volvox africanus]
MKLGCHEGHIFLTPTAEQLLQGEDFSKSVPSFSLNKAHNMSYTVHRPSILHRRQRPEPSRANEESLEAQYEKEQALLKLKQDRQQETHQRLLRSLNPQPEDKAAAWEALVAGNAVLASRNLKDKNQGHSAIKPSPGNLLPEGARPWHHSMATQQYSEADEAAARRRFAAEVAAENQRLAREKEMMKMLEEQARRQPAEQDTWYSRGDTHRQSQPLFSSGGGITATVSPTPTASLRQSSCPWAPADVQAMHREDPMQWQPKTSDRTYPWTWQ